VAQVRKTRTLSGPTDAKGGGLVAAYRAQPAKFILLGVLAVIMVVVLVVNVFIRGAAKKATASNTSIAMPLSGGSGRAAVATPPQEAAAGWRYRDVAAAWANEFVLMERLGRDPFQVDLNWFPLSPDGRQSTTVQALLADGSKADPLTQHIRQWAADVNRQRQARASEVAAVQSEATTLKLSTIMVGGSDSFAVINGEALRVGQRISGFTLVRIEPDRVIVNKNGIPVILALDR
jgi:hypothetical protein